MNKYTVGALFLHALVLFWFASDAYFVATRPFPNVFALFALVLYGSMGILSIWLSRQHYTKTVDRRRIEYWALFSMAIAYYWLSDLITIRGLFTLEAIFPILIFITPPMLIIISVHIEHA